MSENVLRVENVTMQFGGVVAVDNMNLEVNQGRDRFPDWPQRRRQNHCLQRHHRRLRPYQRLRLLPGEQDHRKSPPGQDEEAV